MRETYTKNEAARALGITRRTLDNWIKEAHLIEPGKRRASFTQAEVEILAGRHKRKMIDIESLRDPLQEITRLQEQMTRLETRVIFVEGQLQTLTSLLGGRLALEDKADEQKSDTP